MHRCRSAGNVDATSYIVGPDDHISEVPQFNGPGAWA
jgi:hypothetical protein